MKNEQLYDVFVNIDEKYVKQAENVLRAEKTEIRKISVSKGSHIFRMKLSSAAVLLACLILSFVIIIENSLKEKRQLNENQFPMVSSSSIAYSGDFFNDNKIPLGFSFITIPCTVKNNSDFTIECTFGLDSEDWMQSYGNYFKELIEKGIDPGDQYDFSLYITNNLFYSGDLYEWSSISEDTSKGISFYDTNAFYKQYIDYEQLESDFMFDAGCISLQDGTISFSNIENADSLPFHLTVPVKIDLTEIGTKGSIFVGFMTEEKTGKNTDGNVSHVYYYCSGDYIGFGTTEEEAMKNAVPSENPWQTIHKTDPEKDDEGETTDKYRTVKLLAIDFNGDGTAENIEIQEVTEEESLPVYILRAEGSGKNILDYSLGRTHPHWNSFSLCRDGDNCFILGYCPYTNQGISAYSFELYAYSDAEGFYIKDSMSVQFDRNGKEKLPVDEMVSFAERLNGYLMKSEILISTLDGKTLEEGRLPEEVYSWADEYVKGEGLSLTEKLTKCSEIIYDNYHK